MPKTLLETEPNYRPIQALSPEELLTELETAHYLNITPRLMVDLIQQNRIPYHKFGWRTIRIRVSDLLEFMERSRVPSKNIPQQTRITKRRAKKMETVPA